MEKLKIVVISMCTTWKKHILVVNTDIVHQTNLTIWLNIPKKEKEKNDMVFS